MKQHSMNPHEMSDTQRKISSHSLNPKIKQRWVEALRSGKYKQGRKVLFNPNTECYCTLGVLCDLFVQDGLARWAEPYDGEAPILTGDNYSVHNLTPELNDAIGDVFLTVICPTFNVKRGVSDLNDRGYTFAQLADLIEEQL